MHRPMVTPVQLFLTRPLVLSFSLPSSASRSSYTVFRWQHCGGCHLEFSKSHYTNYNNLTALCPTRAVSTSYLSQRGRSFVVINPIGIPRTASCHAPRINSLPTAWRPTPVRLKSARVVRVGVFVYVHRYACALIGVIANPSVQCSVGNPRPYCSARVYATLGSIRRISCPRFDRCRKGLPNSSRSKYTAKETYRV